MSTNFNFLICDYFLAVNMNIRRRKEAKENLKKLSKVGLYINTRTSQCHMGISYVAG